MACMCRSWWRSVVVWRRVWMSCVTLPWSWLIAAVNTRSRLSYSWPRSTNDGRTLMLRSRFSLITHSRAHISISCLNIPLISIRDPLLPLLIYTVGHKKRASLFWTITPAFLDGFQHFVHQSKQKEILHWGITKFATLPKLCLYTTWENFKTHTKQHDHGRPLPALCSIEPVVRNLCRKSSSVHRFQFLLVYSLNTLLAGNVLHSHGFLIKILSSKHNIIGLLFNYTVNIHDMQCDAIMTS